MKARLVLLALALFNLSALAGRSLSIPSFHFSSVHGGGDPATGSYCITANMHEPGPGLGGQVGLAYHKFYVNCSNVSSRSQKVTITVKKGTRFDVADSGGVHKDVGGVAGDITGSPFILEADASYEPIAMASGAQIRVSLTLTCHHNGCKLFWEPYIPVAPAKEIFGGTPAAAPGPAQTCIQINSDPLLQISIEEDHGAITCSLSGFAHRGGGQSDVLQTALPNILLNGGRPF